MFMQIPAGRLVDRFGTHRVMAVAALAWGAITVLLGLWVGYWASSAAQVIAALVLCRFLLGLTEAPTYPGSAAAIMRWFPARQRGTPNAIVQSASYAGEAVTVTVLAILVLALGWRNALFLSALPALLLAYAWWRFGSSSPHEHPGVSASELALITAGEKAVPKPLSFDWARLKERNIIVLAASYFCHGYVIHLFFYWFFIYLVDERGFAVASGGAVAALPTAAAAIFGFLGGPLTDRQARRRTPLLGYRQIIVGAAVVGAAFLLLGAFAAGPILAVAGFTIAIGTRGLVESAYWSAAIHVGGKDSGTVSGAMNMMGNFGGAVSTGVAPLLAAYMGWHWALAVAALTTAVGGLVLVLLDCSARRDPTEDLAGAPVDA
jgi:ACS family glucarate transporter-like MFS transporter